MNLQKLALRRQRVRILSTDRGFLEKIAFGREPMIAACLLERRFRPGGPIFCYLSIPTPDNSCHCYVRKSQLESYRKKTEAWRKFSQAMARWVKVNKAIEKEFRALGKERCEKLALGKGR